MANRSRTTRSSDFSMFLAVATTSRRPFPTLHAHLSCIRQQMPARHPKVRQGEQRHQFCGVPHQPTETLLSVAKLPLDHAERMFDPGSHLSFGLLDLADRFVHGTSLTMILVRAAPGRDLPNDSTTIMLRALFDTGISSPTWPTRRASLDLGASMRRWNGCFAA